MNETADTALRVWFTRLSRYSMSETQRFLLLSILIGLFAGLLVVCFHIAIDVMSWFALGTPAGQNRLATLLSPTVGAAFSAALVLVVFKAAQGSGVNHTKSALYVSDGHVPFSTVIGKFIACSVSIGSGNSLGPEDPSLQMGAGVASLLGRIFHLTRESMRLIAPVGAAAGLAAAFNTPITAVLFVIEEVVSAWNAGVLGSILLSAVSAVVVLRWFLGSEPLFRVPAFQLSHFSELIVYALVGVIGGLLSVVFIKLISRLRNRLSKLPSWTRYVQPVMGGLIIGIIGLALPEVMGAGYGAVDSALHDQFSWRMLLLLGIVKVFVTLLCFGSGIPGGMFAPALFMGAMIGGGVGGLAHSYWPFPTEASSAYVLVGMGTFFAGVFRAPMTSIFMVFELSASYVIILPVMIANTIAYLLSRRLQPQPFFDLIARHEGLDLPSLEQQREQSPLRVEDAMRPAPMRVLSSYMTVSSALAEICKTGVPHCVVAKGRGNWSWISRKDLEAAAAGDKGNVRLVEAFPLPLLPHLYPDVSMDEAMRHLASYPVLPVISRAAPDHILGVITLRDIHKAYGIRREERHEQPGVTKSTV